MILLILFDQQQHLQQITDGISIFIASVFLFYFLFHFINFAFIHKINNNQNIVLCLFISFFALINIILSSSQS